MVALPHNQDNLEMLKKLKMTQDKLKLTKLENIQADYSSFSFFSENNKFI